MKNLYYFMNEQDSKDETPNKEKKDKKPIDTKDVEDPIEKEEENEENKFISLFDDESFLKAFKNTIKQYCYENLLEDEYNSFTVLPLIEIVFENEDYDISIEFESAASFNIDLDGKVIEKEIPDIELIKFKTPEMDDMNKLEDNIAFESISMYIKQSLEEIKKVSR